MAFDLQSILTPTDIGRIDHFLDDLDGTAGNRALQYNLEVMDQFGDVMKMRSGDEVPHLTAQQITQLQTFMASRRAALPADLGFPTGHQVGRATWRFRDGDGTNPSRSLHARVIELDSGGQFVQRHQFNDQPHLSQPQIAAALALLDAQRAKAVAEILP
ncbi:MAG TPA: hypothetical protein VMY40_02005 [Anaerolineae bacterium]|nr:hypothetical protein [Anaerolineae bacterium]